MGLDEDSISPLGNRTGSKYVPRIIGAMARISLSSGNSVANQSIASMESRVTQMEIQFNSMEVIL